MRFAVAGKGGVGKTLISATLARLMARRGFKVLAIDADPAMNLGGALGISASELSEVTPISHDERLIEEKTGRKTGSSGAVFTLNPYVADIVDDRSVKGPDGVQLLVMGTVREPGGGCLCPANALLRALLRHILLHGRTLIVMDMEAGLEHLGRSIAKGFDVILNVLEPSVKSVSTALRIEELAKGIGVGEVVFVANKVLGQEDLKFIKRELNRDLLSWIPLDPAVREADIRGVSLIDYAPDSPAVESIESISSRLEANLLYSP